MSLPLCCMCWNVKCGGRGCLLSSFLVSVSLHRSLWWCHVPIYKNKQKLWGERSPRYFLECFTSKVSWNITSSTWMLRQATDACVFEHGDSASLRSFSVLLGLCPWCPVFGRSCWCFCLQLLFCSTVFCRPENLDGMQTGLSPGSLGMVNLSRRILLLSEGHDWGPWGRKGDPVTFPSLFCLIPDTGISHTYLLGPVPSDTMKSHCDPES